MTDPNDALNKVFTGLREAQPSPGFERRLRQTLATREAATIHPIRRGSWLFTRPLPSRRAAALASVAALLLVAIALTVLSWHHPSAPRASASAPLSTAPASAPPPHPNLTLAATPPSEEVTPKQTSPLRPHHAHLPGSPADLAHLASFPAPPLPLTEQEKLLLRAAHAQNPQQSPILNPALRASLTARERESFQIFFAPATTITPFIPTN